MADLISYQNGNLTGATTFKGVVTSTGAKQANITGGSSSTSTSYVYSPAFTVTNGNVVEGLLLHCNRINTTGTVTVALSDDNGTTATRTVTVNASDLPQYRSWVFFKFGTTLTGDGGTDYKVGVIASDANNATFYRSATTGDWSRYLRISTTASAAAGDVLFVVGELTGAGTSNAVDVTIDSAYGNNISGLEIGKLGKFKYSDATVAPTIQFIGNVNVWADGTLEMGTSGSPLTREGANLRFSLGSNRQFGLLIKSGGTWNCYGSPRTSGKVITWCRLNTDEAIASTSLGVDTDTGWLDNDQIVVAATGITSTQYERVNLNGNAGASTLTIDGGGGAGGGLAFAHSGTSPFQAEVILLTRNVSIFGTSTSFATFITVEDNTTVNVHWTRFYNISGVSSTTSALDIQGSNGTRVFKHCAFYDTATASGRIISGAALEIDNCVFAKQNQAACAVVMSSTTILTNSVIVSDVGNGVSVLAIDTATLDNVFVSSSVTGFLITGGSLASTPKTFSNIGARTCSTRGIDFASSSTFTASLAPHLFDGVTVVNCANGIRLGSGAYRIQDGTFSGSSNQHILMAQFSDFKCVPTFVELTNCTFAGSADRATNVGIYMDMQTSGGYAAGARTTWVLNSCTFGQTYSHSQGDINFYNVNNYSNVAIDMTLRNCSLLSSTEIANPTRIINMGDFESVIGSQRHDGTAGSHKYWKTAGVGTTDSTIYNTASPSERLTPSNATVKVRTGTKKVAIANATTKTVSVYVRKSQAGDGTAYNGNQPRLRYKANVAAGVTSEGTLDTMTLAVGNWEQLTGTTPAITDDAVLEFYVDCDGTAGWINVDDWTVS